MPNRNIVSLSAVRAELSGKAQDWTPRDACMAVIALIDAGSPIDKLIICYDGPEDSGFQNATPDVMTAVGLLQVTQLELYNKARES